ncbi:TorF family putative porin [Pseudomonas sp. 2FE]|uniref:TorF family putative porin n=1 Tax=Pseudomonas sp. 2FE TaxID=2502190 RepID=UPI0010F83B98|nr:TorF family putative porin [Pseudomonas sp. 2FE]
MHTVKAITLAGLTLLTLSTAQAVELNDQFGLVITPKIVSDYRSSGISQTLGDPAAQLDLMLTHASGLYAGAWTTNVDFGKFIDEEGNDHSFNTRQEVDYYAGYYWQLTDDISLDTMYGKYTYPGESQFNSSDITATLDMYGVFLGAKHTVDTDEDTFTSFIGYHTQLPFEVGFEARFENVDYKDEAFFNRDFSHAEEDYNNWSLGLTRDLVGVTWGLSYVDTDLSDSECLSFSGYDDLCSATLVVSASKTF